MAEPSTLAEALEAVRAALREIEARGDAVDPITADLYAEIRAAIEEYDRAVDDDDEAPRG